jgi:DNA mismatch repair protein MutS
MISPHSLMFPGMPSGVPLTTPDLGLDSIAAAFGVEARYTNYIRQTLSTLITDPVVIAWRQAVLNDFLNNPSLVETVASVLPNFIQLRTGRATLGKHQRSLLLETADRLAELDMFLKVVGALLSALNSATLRSEALQRLHANLKIISDDPQFQKLQVEMPELQRPLQNVASMTIGVNLDSQLQPTSTVLLRINDTPFTDKVSLLEKLLGSKSEGEEGIAPLHYTPSDPGQRPLSVLFQDLEHLITQSTQPVARALARYVRISSAPLSGLENELAFYVAAVRLIAKLRAQGVPFCQPEIAPADERVSQIEGLVNLNLALRTVNGQTGQAVPVQNDAVFDDTGRIAILTGPNSGGKTTYLQAVGLAHVLFQAGLFIPAVRARISPVDDILTHFPALETQQGRLAEEASRLRNICLKATRYSLVLLNESLSSTIASEALYLAQDLLCSLRYIGVRAVYATHLVELAERIVEMEKAVQGDSAITSLIAGVEIHESDGDSRDIRAVPTFRITRGAPQGRGYAREIARRYGISLEQILDARKSAEK